VIVRSFVNMAHAELGVQPASVQAIMVNLPGERYPGELPPRQFFERLTAALRNEGRVRSVSLASELPAGNGRRVGLEFDTDAPSDAMHRQTISTITIGPSYFSTVGATVLSGRDFTLSDDPPAPAVAIVNQRFVETYWRGENALGKRLRVYDGPAPGPWLTVVGVASNVVQNVTDRQVKDPLVYRPFGQKPARSTWVVVRTPIEEPPIATGFRKAIDTIDPDVAIWIGPQSLTSLMAAMGNYWQLGNNTAMFGTFAIIALFLSVTGSYAVVAYSVARRTKEFAIRMAIGATSGDVLALVLRESGRPLIVGAGAGVLASLVLTPLLRSQLVHVSTADPFVIASAAIVLVASGLLGSALPARRAARVGVATALKDE
jgi:putative ABC transport system permease protein